jgi:hypothetical protein
MFVCFNRIPEIPLMPIVNVPVSARLPTVSVKVLAEVVGFGLKEAVILLGNPDGNNLTLSVKPFTGETLMVTVPLVPRVILRLVGEAERVKFGPALMVTGTVIAPLRSPHVPVTVTLYVPVARMELAVKVSVLVPVVLLGLSEAVRPLGAPDTDILTVPLKKLTGFTLIVLAP